MTDQAAEIAKGLTDSQAATVREWTLTEAAISENAWERKRQLEQLGLAVWSHNCKREHRKCEDGYYRYFLIGEPTPLGRAVASIIGEKR